MENKMGKKPKILCLHPHASSGAQFKVLLQVWPSFVLEKMELVFIDAPFPYTREDHRHTHIYPTFVWYNEDTKDQYDKEFEECVTYIEDSMLKLGPFDGTLSFSQGSLVAAALPGMQAQGVALTKVEAIKFVMLISPGKLGGREFSAPKLAENAFSSPIQIPSLHIFGKDDIAKLNAIELLESFVDPMVIFHSGGHEVPKLDEESLKVMLNFLNKIQALIGHRISSLL